VKRRASDGESLQPRNRAGTVPDVTQARMQKEDGKVKAEEE